MMCNKYQQQNSKDLTRGQGAHRRDVTNQTTYQKKEQKKIKRGKEREGKANERRREKGRDKREGMKGYLETPPPSLTTVPNGEMLLAPFASLKFLSLLIFSGCFCVLLFSV